MKIKSALFMLETHPAPDPAPLQELCSLLRAPAPLRTCASLLRAPALLRTCAGFAVDQRHPALSGESYQFMFLVTYIKKPRMTNRPTEPIRSE